MFVFCWNIYYRFWLFSPGEMSKKSILWFILFKLYCGWAQKLQWFDWLLMHAIENLNKQKVWCVVYRIIWYLTNYLIIFFLRTGGGGVALSACAQIKDTRVKNNVTKTVVHNFIIQKNPELIGVALQQILIIKYMILFLKLIYRQYLLKCFHFLWSCYNGFQQSKILSMIEIFG